MPPTDALVHIAAPTTKENDDRFVQQVLAYPGFLAARRHNILRCTSASLEQSSSSAVQNPHVQKGDSRPSTFKARGPVLRAARKTASAGLNRYASGRAHLKHPGPSGTHHSPIACTNDIDHNLSNPSLSRLDNTQQLFDTQQAAAGIESQISTLSDDGDTSPNHDGFARPSKRRRASLNVQDHVDHQSSTTRPSTSPRSQGCSITPTREARWEAGRKSSPLACAAPRELTPSTALERRIQDFQTLRETHSDLFANSELGLDQFDAVISSILPDTYGLSKSNRSTLYGTPEEDGALEGRSGSGDVLSVQSESRLNTMIPQSEVHLQDPGDERIVGPVEKRQDLHNPALAKDIIEQQLEQHGWSSAAEDIPVLAEIQTVLETIQPARIESSLSVTSDLSAHAQRSWQRLSQEESPGSLRVPKSTRIPSASSGSPSKSPCKFVPACMLVGKLIRNARTEFEESANVSEVVNPVLNGLKAIPQQIFPYPASVHLGAAAGPELSAPAVAKPRLQVAEHQLLYRPTLHRTLGHLERGYWECNLQSWEPSFQLKFLEKLTDVVEQGSVGLSPWVEVQHDCIDLPYQIHVYCSAQECREIWVILHVLSRKRLGQQESHWIDWQGEPAITVPARSERDMLRPTARDTRA